MLLKIHDIFNGCVDMQVYWKCVILGQPVFCVRIAQRKSGCDSVNHRNLHSKTAFSSFAPIVQILHKDYV